jgi:hypothetical protein
VNASYGELGRGWRRAVEEHRAALFAAESATGRCDPERWGAARPDGTWTPAEIAEHLALAYEASLRELAGEGSMQLRLTPLRRALGRWLVLPHMLFHRTFPIRARSPREVRPGEAGADPATLAARLRELGDRFERAIVAAGRDGGLGLTHPYFGRISPLRSLRFMAVHLEHHTRQLVERGARPAEPAPSG